MRGFKRPAAEFHAARFHGDESRQAFEERGLAGTVGADQPQHLCAPDGKAGVLKDQVFSKALGNSLGLKQRWVGGHQGVAVPACCGNLFSNSSAYSAPAGVSSCLKNTYTSRLHFSNCSTRSAISLRSSAEYSGMRKRQ